MRRREIARPLRRDRRVRRRRAVHRHAGQAVLERHVRPARASRSRRTSRPDILLVDEVLAVGDAEFQRKCLGKMQRGAPRAAGRSSSSATTWRPCSGSATARSCIEHGQARAGPAAATTSSRPTSSRRRAGQLGGEVDDRPETPRDRRRGRRGSSSVAPARTAMAATPTTCSAASRWCRGDVRGQRAGRRRHRRGRDRRRADGSRIATAPQHRRRPRATARSSRASHESRVELALALLPGEFAIDLGLHAHRRR